MLKSGCWLPAHTHAPTAAVHAPHRTRCPSPHGAPRSGQERGPRRVDFSSQGRRGTPSAQTLHLQPNPTNPHTAGESRPSRGESSGTWASSSSGSATEKRPQARCCATRCCAMCDAGSRCLQGGLPPPYIGRRGPGPTHPGASPDRLSPQGVGSSHTLGEGAGRGGETWGGGAGPEPPGQARWL